MTDTSEALGVLGDDEKSEAERIEAARRLGKLGSLDVIWPMLTILERTEANLGLAIAEALRAMNAGVLLAEELKVSVAARRERAAMALVRIADPRVVDALVAAAKDAEAKVRVQVYQALSRFEGGSVVDTLQAGLADAAAEVRCLAAHALGKKGVVASASAIAKALAAETDGLARDYFAKALKKLGR